MALIETGPNIGMNTKKDQTLAWIVIVPDISIERKKEKVQNEK